MYTNDELFTIINKQDDTIKNLNNEIVYLKNEIIDLKEILKTQNETVKLLILNLENERLNNERLLFEIKEIRNYNEKIINKYIR